MEGSVGLSDSAQVDAFLVDLQQAMESVVTNYSTWLPRELREAYRRAFSDTADAFAQAREWLQDNSGADDALRNVGLSGSHLDVKLGGFRRWYNRFVQRPSKFFMRRALKWGNVVLGSLASAFPPAEIIKEFKESLEAGLEDEEGSGVRIGNGPAPGNR